MIVCFWFRFGEGVVISLVAQVNLDWSKKSGTVLFITFTRLYFNITTVKLTQVLFKNPKNKALEKAFLSFSVLAHLSLLEAER